MKVKDKKKVLNLEGFTIYIDAEWVGNDNPVSVQLTIVKRDCWYSHFIVINEMYKGELDLELLSRWGSEKNVIIEFLRLGKDINTVHTLIEKYYLPTLKEKEFTHYCLKGEVFMFYSFQDLGFAFGWNNVEKQIRDALGKVYPGRIEQKRNISGVLKIKEDRVISSGRWKIKDLSGLTNSGLQGLAATVGIDMTSKNQLDDMKSCMDRALLERTEVFLNYALDDVLVLEDIFSKFIDLVNNILRNTLRFPKSFCFTRKTIPLTVGSLVAKTFEKFLYLHAYDYSDELHHDILAPHGFDNLDDIDPGKDSPFLLALWSLSAIKRNVSNRDEVLKIYNEIFEINDFNTVFEKAVSNLESIKEWKVKSPFETLPYSSASIESIALGDKRTTSVINALVSGGRANNEMPWEYEVDYACDIDLQSCYGSALASLTYPVGIPTCYAYTQNEIGMTLGEFLEKNECELIPGLYKIVVSGKLPFPQDLLYSKVTSFEKMLRDIEEFNRKYSTELEDAPHIYSDFVLSRMELCHSVITDDVLKVLRAVCTSRELKEIYNLRVDTALFWKKSDRCATPYDWMKAVLGSKGRLTYDESYQSVRDERSRKWYGIPLNLFIGRLVEERGRLKKLSKTTDDPSEKITLSSLQNTLKLFINTLYGVFASPYFTIGNVVLADVITARARMEVWKLCKALNLRQSITDGGLYSPMNVNSFKQGNGLKKLGLSTLNKLNYKN